MSKQAEAAAMETAKSFLRAFNAQDPDALAATLNYPHVRLANGEFARSESAEAFAKVSRTYVAKSLEAEGWHHSDLKSIEVVHSGDDKVHMALTYDRCGADGSPYLSFDTLWIATLQDGHWGIQFRSSYLRPVVRS